MLRIYFKYKHISKMQYHYCVNCNNDTAPMFYTSSARLQIIFAQFS